MGELERTLGAMALAAAGAVSVSAQEVAPVDSPYVDLDVAHALTEATDLDADGHLDLVMVEPYAGDVYVARGGPGGALRPAVHVAALGGWIPDAIAADLDGDGDVDLALLRSLGSNTLGEVHLLRGDGAGGLAPGGVHPVSWAPHDLEVGDLDGDGATDLVVTCEEAASVSVLLGLGDGRFSRHLRYAAGYLPGGLALGDLDGDGALDAVVTSETFTDSLRVLPGDGEGGFGAPIPTGAANGAPALGDLDGDGDLDLAAVAGHSSVAVFENVGGALVPAGSVATTYEPIALALADMDGDGALDLVSRSQFEVRVFVGDGQLGFELAGNHETLDYGADLVVADLDEDGHLDVLATPRNNGASSLVTLLPGTGHGPLHATYWDVERGAVVADFDADGLPDLMALRMLAQEIVVLPGLAGGGLGPAVASEGWYQSGRPVAADLDGDGFLDVVLGGSKLRRFMGQGDLTFGAGIGLGPNCSISGPLPAAGDLDGDGDIDVLGVCFYETDVYLNHGDGTFTAGASYPPPAPYAGASKGLAELVDLDADGALDLVEVLSGQVAVRLGMGDGTFAPPTSTTIPSTYYDADVGDVDGDGDPDVVVEGASPDSVAVLLNAGDGTFTPGADIFVGTTDQGRRLLADLDGDGAMDLVVSESVTHQNGNLSTLHMLPAWGGGWFGQPVSVTTSGDPYALIAADLDGDGAPELVVVGKDDTTVHRNLTGPWPR